MAGIKLGSTDIAAVKLGSQDIQKIYRGSDLVFELASIDPDAQAFLTATAITDATITAAINQLVLDLKSAGIWSKIDGAYPFAGSTATQHGYNLVDPQATTGAYYLTWAGGWTHTADGPEGNGSNSYADTNWPTQAYANGVHISTFLTDNISSTFQYDAGNVSPDWALINNFSGGTSYYRSGSLANYMTASGAPTTGASFVAGSSDGQTTGSRYLHRNGSQVASDTNGQVRNASGNLAFGASSTGGGNATSKEYTWLSFGSQFITNTEMTAMYNAVNTYKTAMSR